MQLKGEICDFTASEDWYVKGSVLALLGQQLKDIKLIDKALDCLEKAIQMKPNYIEVYFKLGGIQRHLALSKTIGNHNYGFLFLSA